MLVHNADIDCRLMLPDGTEVLVMGMEETPLHHMLGCVRGYASDTLVIVEFPKRVGQDYPYRMVLIATSDLRQI